MKKCSTAQIIRAMILVNFLPMSVTAWEEVEEKPTSPLSLNYESSSNLSLSLTEELMPLDLSYNPDWDGLKKDTVSFLGYQFSIIGMLYVMPASISGWTDETKNDFSIQQYKDNVKQAVWDKDDWWLNYVLHPYWGGTYYVRAQERGFGSMGSFLYAATLSSLYEFGTEAFFEKPSIQDLIVTPGAGYFVGKYFMMVRKNIRKRKKLGPLSGRDKFILAVTDPIGAMNAKVEGWFGKGTQASLLPMFGPQYRLDRVNKSHLEESKQMTYIGSSDFGMKMTLRW